uniref:Uncharacterized protein n=1 Tax=Mycena chlorophos TaxID=658473 RepID=A0ABQ0L1W2_MYCCL|nr:predicted protein [Mycena chlorophos]
MGRKALYLTQQDKATAKAIQKASWEKSKGGRITRAQERAASSRRRTTVARIPRLLPPPSAVYVWLKRQDHTKLTNKPAFLKAVQDGYDSTPIAHWLEDPLFEVPVPEEYGLGRKGSTYSAETHRLVCVVHARRMLALQAREAARRRLEDRGRVDAMASWRNQVQHLVYLWDKHKNSTHRYDPSTQSREHAMWMVYMHWLAVEIDRLYHLKFLNTH